MAKKKGKGHKALERAISDTLDTKGDKLRLVPALMGAYVNGQKTLKVAGRTDFVWVRLRGATSEIAQAFNDVVGEHWDLPILIKRDEMAHDRWRVHARDIRAYEDWGGASYIPSHAMNHSFGDPNQTGGIDPVWIFKRQFMPLLPRPVISGSMAIYIEPDFYYFEGNYHWWPGSGTTSLGGYIPTGAFNARFVTVYLDGELGIPQLLAGPEFDFVSYGPWNVASDPGTYILLPNSSQGIPIAAVRLYTGSTTIGWGDIYDLRFPQQPLGTTGSYVNIYDEGIYQGAVGSIDFIGDNVQAIVSGSFAYVMVTGSAGGGGHETGTMVIYEEDNWLGVFEEMRFIGDGVTALNSGSYVAIAITGTAIDIPATGSVTVYDESVLLGQADALNFAGDNVEAVMSGTTAHIMVTGSAGGGGHETGTMVIYDEGDWLGVFEEMRFIGDGVDAYNSGSYVAVNVPGYTGSTGTYFRAGECVPIETITGGYWKIPEGEFSTGSLCLAVNGVWQTPVTDFAEQWPTSGTFAFGGDIPTGSVVSAQWGAPHLVGGGGGSGDGNIDIYDEGVLLGEADALDFVGDNVEAVMSGTTAYIMVTGSAGGGVSLTVTTGTFYTETVLYDVTLASTTGSIVVPVINQEYDHLRLILIGRCDIAAAAEGVRIYFNNDTTDANYRFAQKYAGTTEGTNAADYPEWTNVPGATAQALDFGMSEARIDNYSVTGTYNKQVLSWEGERHSATNIYVRMMTTYWDYSYAITRIDITPATSDWVAGTRFQLIGIRNTVLVTSVKVN